MSTIRLTLKQILLTALFLFVTTASIVSVVSDPPRLDQLHRAAQVLSLLLTGRVL